MTTSDPAPAGDYGPEGRQHADASGGARRVVQIDVPTRDDNFVRGVSESIGGPIGVHAARPGRRFWVVARIVIALTCFTLMLHWAEKSDCSDGNWAQSQPVSARLLHGRRRALQQRGSVRRQDPVRPVAGRVSGADRRVHGTHRSTRTRLCRVESGHESVRVVLQPDRLGPGRVCGCVRDRPAPAPTKTTLGCRDVRGVASVAADRDRELGSPGGSVRGLRPAGVVATTTDTRGRADRSRYGRETVAGIPAHPVVAVGLACSTTRRRHLYRRRRPARLGRRESAVHPAVSA